MPSLIPPSPPPVTNAANAAKPFTTPHARLNHECRILYAIPDADDTDLFGWRTVHSPPSSTHFPKHGHSTLMDLSTPTSRKTLAGEWQSTVATTPPTPTALCELYAPVCLDKEDQRFLGAEQASNNTGELSAIAEALLWLKDECPGPASIPAEVVYDSKYAADLTLGVTEPHANKELAQHCHSPLPSSQPVPPTFV